jgi:hypothetical protein
MDGTDHARCPPPITPPEVLSAPETGKPTLSLFELGGKAVALAAAAGGCLYVMGWSYANSTFRLWGIPLVSLNISRDYFLSYGVIAVQNEPLWFLFFCLALLACAAFVYARYIRKHGPERAAWSLLFICFVIFVGSSYFGRWSAQHTYEAQRRDGFADLHRAIILMSTDWLKDDKSNRAKHLRRELTELGCYRIVFIGAETVWVARPFNGVNGAPSAELPAVLGLPSKSLDALRIMIGRENCD